LGPAVQGGFRGGKTAQGIRKRNFNMNIKNSEIMGLMKNQKKFNRKESGDTINGIA